VDAGMQIVNGGQTTASMFFTKKKFPATNLRNVRVPAKVIVLKQTNNAQEEMLIADISRFSNSQNKVNISDLSANRPVHVQLEKMANTVYCRTDTAVGFTSERTAVIRLCWNEKVKHQLESNG
jgi:hypothetical protein